MKMPESVTETLFKSALQAKVNKIPAITNANNSGILTTRMINQSNNTPPSGDKISGKFIVISIMIGMLFYFGGKWYLKKINEKRKYTLQY